METSNEKNKSYLKAKEKVKNIQIFYIHLVGYIIVVMLLLYNLYIVAGVYKTFFIWFNISVMVAWTIFILVHGWCVFKGRRLFNKSWEERKMKAFIEKEEQKKK
tara:strand:- start:10912 stop:11223 length:312 start_codon:yes stop_codon:yes gene_type:complete